MNYHRTFICSFQSLFDLELTPGGAAAILIKAEQQLGRAITTAEVEEEKLAKLLTAKDYKVPHEVD